MQGLHRSLLLLALTSLVQSGHGSQIIDGEVVPENSMLYMVSVQNKQGHVCGGFLVSEGFVVTAAHCDRAEPTHVVLGSHDLKDTEKVTYRHIERRYKPNMYVNEGRGNDIMILKLSKKADINNRVETIPLPASEMNLPENQQCVVAGWGKTYTHGSTVHKLRMVDVSVLSLPVCKQSWTNLPDKVICAGGYGTTKGFCQGDSGGPLVCNGIAVGVVSFNRNLNCDYPDAPNVYTDISKHLLWINSIIEP
ncbi:duodenase-1-like [Betta splendens]|uniref:Duodenase-1-like n=1 Tax=Betta splendens TaxID=158456 RepID=A0A6P7MCF4_BETSP|nr:duodenase-1-like [Betta splendens]